MFARLGNWFRSFLYRHWEPEFLRETLEKGRRSLAYFGFIVGTLSLPLVYLDAITLKGTFYALPIFLLDTGYVLLCYLVGFRALRQEIKGVGEHNFLIFSCFSTLAFVCGTVSGVYPPEFAFFPFFSVVVGLCFLPILFILPFEHFFLQVSSMAVGYLVPFAVIQRGGGSVFFDQITITLSAIYLGSYVMYFSVTSIRLRDFQQRQLLSRLSQELKEQNLRLEELVQERYRELMAENKAREEAEARLRESSLRYKTVVQNSFQAIVEVDAWGRILSLEFPEKEFLGWEPSELIGRSIQEFQEDPEADRGWREVIRENPWREQKSRVRDRQGREIWLRVRGGPYHTLAGEERFLFVLQDITREEELERRLEVQNRIATLGMLAEGITHNFKNSLTTLLGLYEFLEKESRALAPKIQEFVQMLGNELRHLQHMIQELLAFSRERTAYGEPLELKGFFQEFLPLLRVMLPETIRVEVKEDDQPLWVRAHPVELKNLLLNLAINSRDAMPEGGNLLFLLEKSPGGIVVRVKDNGAGIPPEYLQRVFDPFFTTKPPGMGTGLGLTLVKEWMERWGGKVEISSTPGSGTEVILYFPELPEGERTGVVATPLAGRSRSATQEELGRCRILVVEDDPEVRWVITMMIQESFPHCEGVSDLPEAFNRIAQGRYDLVITDYLLRSGKGIDLVEMAGKRLTRPPKFLVMTGYSGGELGAVGKARGVCGIIEKPFTSEELRSRIKEILAGDR